MQVRIGDQINAGDALATVHAKDETSAREAIAAIQRCIHITKEGQDMVKY